MTDPAYLEAVVKVAQTVFFLTVATVAVLTYRSAKNGLLNTVNTEYHKKVIERLSALSEEMFEEFDITSPRFWGRDDSCAELVRRINEEARHSKDKIITTRNAEFTGIPITTTELRLMTLSKKYKTDPFLPEPVRNKVVGLYEGRLRAIGSAHQEVASNYMKMLSEGKHWDNMEENEHWLHNRINDRLYNQGFGISQVETRVEDIRLSIRNYFSAFNPLPPTGV